MNDSDYSVYYADGRTSLVIEADVARGWKKLEKTYGFNRQTRIPYKNDVKIRAQLDVIVQPATFGEWAKSFPDVTLQLGDNDLSYQLQNGILTLKITMLPHQPLWTKTKEKGRPMLFVEELPLFTVAPKGWYDLRAWIVFHEGFRRPIPDVHVWAENSIVVPGGQFESNRRHH